MIRVIGIGKWEGGGVCFKFMRIEFIVVRFF